MNERTRTTFAALGTLLVVALVTLGTMAALHRGPWAPAGTRAAPGDDLGPVIAEVNGRPIYLGDARSRVEGIVTVHGDIAAALGQDWQQVVFQSLVDDQLLGQEAERLGIEVTEEDLQTWYGQIQSSLGSGQTLEEWMAAQGMTLDEMQRTIARQIIGTRVYAAVTGDVEVTDAQLREYYDAHVSDYTQPDGSVTRFRDVREPIEAQVVKNEESAAYTAWLEERRQAATVTVLLDDWWRSLP